MQKQKSKYLIGVKDKRGNLYLITNMKGNITDSLFPIELEKEYTVPETYLFPYHTFPKVSPLNKTENLHWTLIKVQMDVDDDEESELVKNLFVAKNAKVYVVEEILWSLGIGKAVFNTIVENRELDIKSILDIRTRLLDEHAFFEAKTDGEITSYLEILNYSCTDTPLNKLFSRDHLFPLTVYNIERYPFMLSKNTAIDYSFLQGPKPFGLGEDFIDPSDLKKFKDSDLVTLYKNCPNLYVGYSNYINQQGFIVEAIKQEAKELIALILGSSTYDLASLVGKVDWDNLLAVMNDDFPYFHKEPSDSVTGRGVSWQAKALSKIFDRVGIKSHFLLEEEFDTQKVRALVDMGSDAFISSLSVSSSKESLDEIEKADDSQTLYPSKDGKSMLYIKDGKYYLCEGSVLVLVSDGAKGTDDYLFTRNNTLIEKCLGNGTAKVRDGEIVLQKDIVFGQPSFPATLVYGKWTNGWKFWSGLKETGLQKERKKRTTKGEL